MEWIGVMPAVTKKFTKDDKLDLDTFAQNIQAQLQAGVQGIILGGTLGEASTLDDAEKKRLLQTTLYIVADEIPVVINIAEQTTKGAIKAVEDAEEHGAQGIMALPPMRYKATNGETVAYFRAIASATSLPIMIYNNPVDYKIMVTMEMFEALLVHDNIKAVKDSTRDITNITRFRNRFGNRLQLLCGVDTLAMESLLLGADGWVAGLVCAFPRETVAIYELAKAGRIVEATEIYRWFMPLLELDISPQLVQNIKLAEAAVGMGTEYVRLPRLPLTGRERERVTAIVNEALLTRPKMPMI